MSTAKASMQKVLDTQPEDASYEDIMRELAFDRMITRGLADVRAGRVIDNEEMKRRIRQWK